MKRTLGITGLAVLIIILILVLFPFLFKGKIEKIVRSEINKKLNAKVSFGNTGISIFHHFPDLTLSIDNISVEGVGDFSKDTLISAKSFGLSFNLMSVIRGKQIEVNSIDLDHPGILAIVNRNGKANWDIFKPDTTAADTAAASKSFSIHLKKYAIHNALIVYRDEQSGIESKIVNLNHEGQGDFTSDLFTLKTATTADEINVIYGGIPWLNRVKTSIDADIQVNAKENKYMFQTEKIVLNDLTLAVGGFFQVNDSSYNMDINFKTLSASFKSILSFIPAIYQRDFSSLKTDGKLAFNGAVKGVYNDSHIPAYHIYLDIKNGFFQYPDLPKAVKNVNLTASVDNPDGVTDHTVVNVPAGHIEMDNNPFDFRLNIKRPVSDLLINAAAKGRLDLSGITGLVKMEKGTKLSGLLNADVSMNGSVAALRKKQYGNFDARGKVALNNFGYVSSDYPAGVRLNSLLLSFNPRNVTLSNTSGNYLNTDFVASGTLNNILLYVLKNEPLNGIVNLSAGHVDLNRWMGTPTKPAGGTTTSSEPFVVPAGLDIILNAKAASVHYDKLDISDLSGVLHISDETVKLENVKGKALDGTIEVGGYYSTKASHSKPDISLSYDVKNVDIKKTFYAFNTIQKLMPVGKFIAGKLSSSLTMTGKLGENMTPDLSTLTGKGDVLLLEGILSKFKPVETIANSLNISALKQISLKDIKSYFEFAAGKVLVKPFSLHVKDIDMEIGGMHGFDQSLDYTIDMKVPRQLMGEKGNTVVNGLIAKAADKGLPLTVSDKLDLLLKLGGSVTRPVIKTGLKQSAASLAQNMKEQSEQLIQAKVAAEKQRVTSAIKDSVTSARKRLLEGAKTGLMKTLSGNSDTTSASGSSKKSIEETGKGLLKSINPFKKKAN